MERAKTSVSQLAFGTMAIGGQVTSVTDAVAQATLLAAIDGGVALFDTAPQYGCGLAEERLGRALAARPGCCVAVSTKVGKRIAPEGSGGDCQRTRFFPGGHAGEMVFDYSADATYRIVDASLQRLGVQRLDHVLMHDIIRHFHGDEGVHVRAEEALRGAVPALRDLQRQGLIGAIGVGLKDVDIAERFVREAGVETVLVPGRLTLLDQTAVTSGLLAACRDVGARYIAAAPFDSGILAQGAQSTATYGYRPADAQIRDRVAAIERLCAAFNVPLAQLALQFPLQFPGVTFVLAGMRSPDEVQANLDAIAAPTPAGLFEALYDARLVSAA